MTVAEIIERLTRNYTPETVLACEWTDKETYESYADTEVSDKLWSAIVREYDHAESGSDVIETLDFFRNELDEDGEDEQ